MNGNASVFGHFEGREQKAKVTYRLHCKFSGTLVHDKKTIKVSGMSCDVTKLNVNVLFNIDHKHSTGFKMMKMEKVT